MAQRKSDNMIINTHVPAAVFNRIEEEAKAAHITKAARARQVICEHYARDGEVVRPLLPE